MKAVRVGLAVLVVGVLTGALVYYAGPRWGSDSSPPAPRPFVVAIPTYPGFALPYLGVKRGLFGGGRSN